MSDSTGMREIGAADPDLRRALEDAGLPTGDLVESGGRFFRYERNGVPAGFGGFEAHGGNGLLRSIVVLPEARGTGAGRAVTAAVLGEMRACAIGHAYLLTSGSEDFFRHLGFRDISRDSAPEAILRTRQAATICASAAMLTRETA